MKLNTKCIRSGYEPKNGDPAVMPIVQSTTYFFETTERISELFDMPTAHMYSRFSNPTCEAVEKKIADLEGGVGAMLTSSGQAANLIAILNICSAGESFIASPEIYGGTVNLFAVTMKRFGIECIFAPPNAGYDDLMKLCKPNTKAVFGEVLANPSMSVLDIETYAKAAHDMGVPLIVDNTFPTPVFCRPFEHGADIVTHSTTKYMDGHALQVGGVIVDSGNFDWTNGKFPDFTEPDESYHGIVYVRDMGKAAYITKARMQLMRDFGSYPAANSAFLLNLGLETLPIRMKQYSENGLAVAKLLEASDKVVKVNYPALESNEHHEMAKKYLPDGMCGVVTFVIKGGKKAAVQFLDNLKLACNEVHVADIRTCVLHPASATHRQLTDDQLVACGINPGMIRLSVGLEDIEDITNDIKQALDKVEL